MNAPSQQIRFQPTVDPILEEYRKRGYAVLRNVIDPAVIAALDEASLPVFARTPFSKGSFYGERTKRFLGLLKHMPGIAALVQHQLILKLATQILDECDSIQLNSTQAIEVHPGALPQPPHRDQVVWHERSDEFDFVVSVACPFNDYSAHVGTTRIWPSTHLYREGAYDVGRDPVDIEMGPGDALLFSGRVMHGQGTNESNRIRRGIIFSYSLGWLKPFENMMLTYPPAVARRFPPGLAELIGYRMQRPNLGSVGGKCPSILLQGEAGEIGGLGFNDMFTPELARRVEAFHDAMRAA